MNGPPRSADCRGGLFRYIEWGYSQITINLDYSYSFQQRILRITRIIQIIMDFTDFFHIR